jgi:hypothetical protein
MLMEDKPVKVEEKEREERGGRQERESEMIVIVDEEQEISLQFLGSMDFVDSIFVLIFEEL